MTNFIQKIVQYKLQLKLGSNYQAVTLVEALVYLAILASVFSVIFEFALIISNANRTEEIELDLQTNKVIVVQNMEEVFADTTNIDTTNSVFDTGDDILILNNETGTYSYYVVNGRLVVDNHGTINNLISTDFWVNNFTATPIYDHLGVVSGVEINLTFHAVKDSSKSANIQRAFTYK